jgi:hypothetical protein
LVTHQTQNIERICTQCNVMSHGRTVLATCNIPEAIKLYRGLAAEVRGKVEYVYGPNAPLVVEEACFADHVDAVLIKFRASSRPMRPFFATYAICHAGSELLRGTNRESPTMVVPASSGMIRVRIPSELRRLGELKLNTTLWDAGSQQPIVWIKGISIPCEEHPSYCLSFEPLPMAR